MDSERDDGKDSLDFTPEMSLQDALKDIHGRYKDSPPDKALVIFLWDAEPGQYNTSFWNAGMKVSECLSLTDVMRHRFLNMITPPE